MFLSQNGAGISPYLAVRSMIDLIQIWKWWEMMIYWWYLWIISSTFPSRGWVSRGKLSRGRGFGQWEWLVNGLQKGW